MPIWSWNLKNENEPVIWKTAKVPSRKWVEQEEKTLKLGMALMCESRGPAM